jgi:hypothetical protein
VVKVVEWKYVKLAIGLGIVGFVIYMLLFGTSAVAPATTATATSGRYRELIREAVEKYLARPVIT